MPFERLQRRGRKYYFRAIVPKRWRHSIDALEIKFSLHTEDRVVANIRCRLLSNAFDMFFREDRLAQIPLDRINEYAKAYFQQRLNEALELRYDIGEDGNEFEVDQEIEGFRARSTKLKAMLRTLDFTPDVLSKAQGILRQAAPDVPEKRISSLSLDAVKYACQLVAQAEILRNNYLETELAGGTYNAAPDNPIFRGILPDRLPEIEIIDQKPVITVGDTIAEYMNLKKGDWGRKTEADQLRCLNFLAELVGSNSAIKDLRPDQIKLVRNTMMNVPKNAMKSKANLGKTLVEAAQSGEGELLSFKTRDKYYTMIRSFLKWAVGETYLGTMPAPNVKMLGTDHGAAIDDCFPYDENQLLAIFKSPLYTGCKSSSRRGDPGAIHIVDAYYWVPLIALFSGPRASGD